VVTFVNKMDREGKEPLMLLDEIEQEFGIQPCAFNWPIGMGERFRGVYDRQQKQVHVFERTDHGKHKAPTAVTDIHDPALAAQLGPAEHAQLVDELDILDGVGYAFDEAAYRRGAMTPVFFGSAATNFGIEPFLKAFLPLAPEPLPRLCQINTLVNPTDSDFSGFIFKIQANMDPHHRDCVAFMRICSGTFTRDMMVKHAGTGKPVRLSHAHKLFAQERETSNEAFAGDIIGFSSNQGILGIGDTVFDGKPVALERVPTFPPELFAMIRNPNPSKYKQFTKGLEQLAQEGAIQVISLYEYGNEKTQVLAAVGQLQFEVIQHRLQAEYNVETQLQFLGEFTHARWLKHPDGSTCDAATVDGLYWTTSAKKAEDAEGNPMALFKGEWALNFMMEKNPDMVFAATHAG